MALGEPAWVEARVQRDTGTSRAAAGADRSRYEAIMRDLGYDDLTIEAYREKGIIEWPAAGGA